MYWQLQLVVLSCKQSDSEQYFQIDVGSDLCIVYLFEPRPSILARFESFGLLEVTCDVGGIERKVVQVLKNLQVTVPRGKLTFITGQI